jgi:hypothetical protein
VSPSSPQTEQEGTVVTTDVPVQDHREVAVQCVFGPQSVHDQQGRRPGPPIDKGDEHLYLLCQGVPPLGVHAVTTYRASCLLVVWPTRLAGGPAPCLADTADRVDQLSCCRSNTDKQPHSPVHAVPARPTVLGHVRVFLPVPGETCLTWYRSGDPARAQIGRSGASKPFHGSSRRPSDRITPGITRV